MDCAPERLTRVVLVPEVQALHEWCAVGKYCGCCVEAIIFLCTCGPSSKVTGLMKINSTQFETLAKANRGRGVPLAEAEKTVDSAYPAVYMAV